MPLASGQWKHHCPDDRGCAGGFLLVRAVRGLKPGLVNQGKPGTLPNSVSRRYWDRLRVTVNLHLALLAIRQCTALAVAFGPNRRSSECYASRPKT